MVRSELHQHAERPKNVKGSSMNTDNKTDGKVSADSTSINLFNKEDKK